MRKNGFTLIELLVVVAVAGVLIFMAILSLNGIQSKGRDAERMNDINNVQQVMRIIKEETGSYKNACGGEDYQGIVSACHGEGEAYQLITYLDSISGINDPLEKTIACNADCSDVPCNYAFASIDNDSYELYFWLERATIDYSRGCHKLTERGIE